VTGARWELLRALGAVAGDPADARAACAALGLPAPGNAEHTEVFVLNCPPYAAVYLGADGALGGDAADRVAGFWRAIGVAPPAEPDHLAGLLSLYASLGEACSGARAEAVRRALTRARDALFWEHLWPWLPAYLEAVEAFPALAAWAALTRRAVLAERAERAVLAERAGHPGGPDGPGARLPLALRAAPAPLSPDCAPGDLPAALTTPVCSGLILTRRTLAAGAEAAGAGHRIGERRFTLRAMLDQEPAATLGWLGAEAARWADAHAGLARNRAAEPAIDAAQDWWARRARRTAAVLCAAAVAAALPCAPLPCALP
jgi:TorA maturation chaperone TorD